MRARLIPFLLAPVPVLAEVSDKVIEPQQMVTYAAILSVVAVVLNRAWPRWCLPISAVTILLSLGGVATIFDEHVGAAILTEQGPRYCYFAIGEVAAVILANVIGAIWGFHAKRRAV